MTDAQPPRKITVHVYFNPKTFEDIVMQAEKSGKRRRGLSMYLRKQKRNTWLPVLRANGKGISKHLKLCAEYWAKHEPERLMEIARLKREKQEKEKQLARLEGGLL